MATVPEFAFPLQRGLRAATPFGFRRRGRALEGLLVVLIVGIVVFEALRSFSAVAAKVYILNAVSLSSTERIEAVTMMATTGEVPDRLAERRPGVPPGARSPFGPPELRDGEVVFPATERLLRPMTGGGADETAARDGAVAFRLARARDSGATVWLCGGETAPAGFEAAPPRHTTIDSRYLPHFCR